MNTFVTIKKLHASEYNAVYAYMKSSVRWPECHELLFVDHLPVYTLGLRNKPVDIHSRTTIPVIQTDRGGQITYHGPGQIVIYPLCHLPSLKCAPTSFVHQLEIILIETLAHFGLKTNADPLRPGLYANGLKIASIGLRVRQHRSYHGIALNHLMDLRPFDNIAPCGYDDIQMTQVSEFIDVSRDELTSVFIEKFCHQFSLNKVYDTQTT